MCADSRRKQTDDKYHPNENLDDDLQRELDDALGSMSIDSLIEYGAQPSVSPAATPGEGVKRGKVIAIHGDDIFVDMGGKSQGMLPAVQFEGKALPEIGDSIEVTIEGYNARDGLLELSIQGAVTAATWETLQEGQVVEGRVTGHNKGGLELDINGIKAFMPISQIETFRVEDLGPYTNTRLRCEVTEVRRSEKTVVVSRRSLLYQEEREAKERRFETLAEGEICKGVVKTIMPYGAFVDIGGVDGLVHVSDMSWSRVEKPEELLKEGQTVEVMVTKVDRAERKVGLSMKQVQADPWSEAAARWPEGEMVTGRVTRLAEFGAFVELEAGVEGLIPISEMSFERRVRHPDEIINEGDMIKVRVMQVDAEARRISLSLKRVGDDPWVGASVRWPEGSVVEGVVKTLTDFGAFVELTPGVQGLIHISELSNERVRMVSDVVREGEQVKARVVGVDEEKRRIALSIKQLEEAVEYSEADASTSSQESRSDRPRKRKKPLKGGLEDPGKDLGPGLGELRLGG